PEDVPRRILGPRRLPPRRSHNREREQAEREKADVDATLDSRTQVPRAPVRIGVPRHQEDLKEHEADGPDGARAAKPRQDLTRDQWLNEEQQERADEDGCEGECGGGRRGLSEERGRPPTAGGGG